MSEDAKPRPPAVLQVEFDRERVGGFPTSNLDYEPKTSGSLMMRRIAHLAMHDTLNNGGTFVLVVSPKTVTIVQRPDAEEIS